MVNERQHAQGGWYSGDLESILETHWESMKGSSKFTLSLKRIEMPSSLLSLVEHGFSEALGLDND